MPQASLAPLPQRLASDVVAFHRPDEPEAAHYRQLAVALAAQLPSDEHQVLLMTAATVTTVTATLALNLGVVRARLRRAPLVLVDANIGQPLLADKLGLPPGPGLREVLAGRVSLQRAVQETGIEDLHVLTAGKTVEEGTGLLAGEAMRSILRHLRLRYDWVLLAAPHWDGRPDLVALGGACDATYLVVTADEAQKPEIQELAQIMPQQGIQLRGCIHVA
jgi:Mrp family chromosome partitioning ATPase